MAEHHPGKGGNVDPKTAKGKSEGGFNPHPEQHKAADLKHGYQGESRAGEDARRTTPAGKARSK
jgi:hypothetical protein